MSFWNFRCPTTLTDTSFQRHSGCDRTPLEFRGTPALPVLIIATSFSRPLRFRLSHRGHILVRGSKSLLGNVTIRVYKVTCKTTAGQRPADSLLRLLFTASEEEKKGGFTESHLE